MENKYLWNVMRLCDAQLKDVNPHDVLCKGLYRKCRTYHSGGGYDKFPDIYISRFGDFVSLDRRDLSSQFVVQLKGCPLRCPYCYVTREGVETGECVGVSTDKLINDFYKSRCSVFHLMGGAPAIYMDKWMDIILGLEDGYIFHSDLLLLEGEYDKEVVNSISYSGKNSLFAVSIKGSTCEEFRKNTGVDFNEELFWANFDIIVESKLDFYLTYTGMSKESIKRFEHKVKSWYGIANADWILKDSFPIQLVKYKALGNIS